MRAQRIRLFDGAGSEWVTVATAGWLMRDREGQPARRSLVGYYVGRGLTQANFGGVMVYRADEAQAIGEARRANTREQEQE